MDDNSSAGVQNTFETTKKVRKRKSDRYAETMEQLDQESLVYDLVLKHAASTESFVRDWAEAFLNEETDTRVLQILNFLLKSSGAPYTMTWDHLNAGFNDIRGILEEIQSQCHNEVSVDYPLVSKKKEFKKFRKNFGDFWQRWIRATQYHLVFSKLSEDKSKVTSESDFFENSTEIWELIKEFIVSMSSSGFRPFRHTATVASLAITTSLVGILTSTDQEIITLQAQLDRLRNKSSSSAKIGDLEFQLDELSEKKKIIEDISNELVDSVFVHRYRDTSSFVRHECVKELSSWILGHPDQYLDSEYLRYVGWSLSDTATEVRQAAVDGLCSILNQSNIAHGLRKFLDRFKGRILEMCISEKDSFIRKSLASNILPWMIRNGIVELDDKMKLYPFVLFGQPVGLTETDSELSDSEWEIQQAGVSCVIELFLETLNNNSSFENIMLKFADWLIDVIETAESCRADLEKKIAASRGTESNLDRSKSFEELQMEDKSIRFRKYIKIVISSLLQSIDSGFIAGIGADVRRQGKKLVDSLNDWAALLDFICDADRSENVEINPFQRVTLICILSTLVSWKLGSKTPSKLTELTGFNNGDTKGGAKKSNKIKKSKLHKRSELKEGENFHDYIRNIIPRIQPMFNMFIKHGSFSSIYASVSNLEIGEKMFDLSCMETCSVMTGLELMKYALIGVEVDEDSSISTSMHAAPIWLEMRQENEYQHSVNLLVDDLLLKSSNIGVLDFTGRILFGPWYFLDANKETHLLSLLDDQNPFKLSCKEALSAKVNDEIISRILHNIDALEVNDFDDVVDLKVLLQRYFACVQFSYAFSNAANQNALFEKLIQKFQELISQSQFVDGKGIGGFAKKNQYLWAHVFSGEIPADDVDEEDEFDLDLIKSENNMSLEEKKSYDEKVSACHIMIQIMHQLLLWRVNEQPSQESQDSHLEQSFYNFIGILHDVLNSANRRIESIMQLTREQAIQKMEELAKGSEAAIETYKPTFADFDLEDADDLDDNPELASLIEKMAFENFSKDKILREMIFGIGCRGKNTGVLAMLSDLYAISLQAFKAKENRIPQWQKLALLYSEAVINATESMFGNFLCQHDNGYCTVALDANPENNLPISLEQWKNRFNLVASFSGFEYGGGVEIFCRTPAYYGPLSRTIVMDALKTSLIGMVRVSHSLSRSGTIPLMKLAHLISRTSSWIGKWNHWIDELAKLMLEELRDVGESFIFKGIDADETADLEKVFVHALSACLNMSMESSLSCVDCAMIQGKHFIISGHPINCLENAARCILGIFRQKVTKNKHFHQADSFRNMISRVFRQIHVELIDAWIERVLDLAGDAGNLETNSTRQVLDDYMFYAFKILVLFIGTSGGFGVDILNAEDAQYIISYVKKVVETQQRLSIDNVLNVGTEKYWEPEYNRYKKLLGNIAKKGDQKNVAVKSVKNKRTMQETSALGSELSPATHMMTSQNIESSPLIKRVKRI